MTNVEQGMMKGEVFSLAFTSSFEIPCSTFDILLDYPSVEPGATVSAAIGSVFLLGM